MAEETVLDAVNATLGDDIAPEPAAEVEELENEGGPAEPEVEEAPEGEEAAPEGEETDAEAEARGAERNADGTFKKKEAEKPAEGEKPAKVEPKPKDPVNDPIPKDLKKETSERIRTLIDTTKTVTAERDQIRTDFDYLVKGVQATGTSPEQYGEALSWLALFNSNNPQQQEKALELVESVAERLATLLGKERSVGDPLSAHSDLKDAVQKGQITSQYAKEIARTRNGQQFRTELTTNASHAQQQQLQATQELATARADLSSLEQTLRASDPSYEAKKAILVPALKAVFASIPPSQWKAKFTEAYRNIKVNAPAAAPRPVPANQPMRAKQPAGGQTKAPSSMLEAVNGALSGMNK
jgi:hypothetical protein